MGAWRCNLLAHSQLRQKPTRSPNGAQPSLVVPAVASPLAPPRSNGILLLDMLLVCLPKSSRVVGDRGATPIKKALGPGTRVLMSEPLRRMNLVDSWCSQSLF